MKRTTILALGVVAVALLLAADAVLAKGIDCAGGKCVGTKRSDLMIGTAGHDEISGRGGNDTILSHGGNDEIHGGDANDIILDFGPGPDVDTIFGDDGDDSINVREGADVDPDVVDCGPGTDKVTADPRDTL